MSSLNKINKLKKFLEDQGFYLEADACSELIKIAIPIMFGDENYETKPKNRKDLGVHGWVYILKTSPAKGGTAPFGWYVGSSTAPEKRFIEHTLTKPPYKIIEKSDEEALLEDRFRLKDNSGLRSDRPDYDPLYDFKSPSFTGGRTVFEVVCMQYVPITLATEGMRDTDALRAFEQEVFTRLAQFVGGLNMGGDRHLMRSVQIGDERIKTKDIPIDSILVEPDRPTYDDDWFDGGESFKQFHEQKESYAKQVEAFISKTFGCDSGPGKYSDFAKELDRLEWKHITKKDRKNLENSHRLYEGKWKKEQEAAIQWVEENLGSLSVDQAQKLRLEIEDLIRTDIAILDNGSLLRSLGENIPLLNGIDTSQKLSVLATRYFGDNWLRTFKNQLGYENQKSNIIKALRSSHAIRDAHMKLNLSYEALQSRMKHLDINPSDYLGKEPEYIVFRESGEKVYKQDIEKALTCGKNISDAARILGRDNSNNKTFYLYVYDLFYPNLPREEQKRKLHEDFFSRQPSLEDREWAKEKGFTCFNPSPSRYELIEALIASNGNTKEAAKILNTTAAIIKARRKEEGLGAVAFRKILLERMSEESHKDPDVEPDSLG